jgi:hypothetical protein
MDGIRTYQAIAQQYNKDEAFVSSFAEEIVRNTNKTVANNYIIIREFPVRSVGITENMKRSDICIVEVLQNINNKLKPILIIECKIKDQAARNALVQLTGYMRDVECMHGITLSPNIANVYIDPDPENNMLPTQIGDEINISNTDGIVKLIDYINNI